MGRRPLSAEAHKALGTYQKCRHENSGVKFNPAKNIPMPEEITDAETVKMWNDIIPLLCEKGLVSIVEVPILQYAFLCYQNSKRCESAIKYAGGICAYLASITNKDKDLSKYQRDFMGEFNQIMFKFGMTPAENPKVKGNKTNPDDDVSGLLAMHGRG